METNTIQDHQSKVQCLEDAIFESGAEKHTAHFTETLEKIAKYVQKKYNSDIANIIKDVEQPQFDFSTCSVPQIITDVDGMMTQEKINEMDIYIWKKDYKLMHSQKAKFSKKEKKVFPITFDQCSTSLRSQLEGARLFEET